MKNDDEEIPYKVVFDCHKANVRPMDSITLIFDNKSQIWRLIRKLAALAIFKENVEMKYFLRIYPYKMSLVSENVANKNFRT